jgi:glycogen debranching enzyme
VRTLAVGEGRYNPTGYHVGTIWPFDNSFIAWRLRRYGFKAQAAQIAAGILEAAEFFDARLPEAFGGYPRSITKYPVQHPTACSPRPGRPLRRCWCWPRCWAWSRLESISCPARGRRRR